METLYEDVIVEIPFHYAGAETKEEKFQLEYDAADFFTSSYSHEIQDPNTNNVIRKVFGEVIRLLPHVVWESIEGDGNIPKINKKTKRGSGVKYNRGFK